MVWWRSTAISSPCLESEQVRGEVCVVRLTYASTAADEVR
jgi:hypothetical protein